MAYEEFDMCIKPDPKLIIWRYMDLAKFESMLMHKALFFCRADKFADPFEGSIPKKEAQYRIKERERIALFYNADFDVESAKKSIELVSEVHRRFKKQHIINCWHINNSENDSMWRLYLKDNEGIAIRTSVENLIKSFSDTEEAIFCSKVRYLDYENDIWYDKNEYPIGSYNLFVPLIHKRIEFRQEEEIRLIHKLEIHIEKELNEFWSNQPSQKGINIKCDLNTLINEVYCAPTSDDKQIIKVKNLLNKYGFKQNVYKSKLNSEPYY